MLNEQVPPSVCLNLSPYSQQNLLLAHQEYMNILSTNISFPCIKLIYISTLQRHTSFVRGLLPHGSDRNCPNQSHNLLKSFKLFISITYYLWVFMENQNCKSQCEARGPCSCKEQVERGSAQGLNGEF